MATNNVQGVTADRLEAAFVLARYTPVIRAVCRKLVRDRDKRDDAFQEAAMRIVRRIASYDPARSGLSCWVHVVSRSAVLDYLRREARVGDTFQVDFLDEQPGRESDPVVGVIAAETIATGKRLRVMRYLASHPTAGKRTVCRAIGCDRDLVRLCRTVMERAGFQFPCSWRNQYRQYFGIAA